MEGGKRQNRVIFRIYQYSGNLLEQSVKEVLQVGNKKNHRRSRVTSNLVKLEILKKQILLVTTRKCEKLGIVQLNYCSYLTQDEMHGVTAGEHVVGSS